MAAFTHPLTGNQRLVWQVQRLAPDNPLYSEAIAGRILSDLDLHALRLTCQWLLERHPALRATFSARHGEPEQVVHDAPPVSFKVHDARDWDDAEVRSRFDREVHRPFNLEMGPLFRAHVFVRTPGQHQLLLSFHHIAADFYSLMLILAELRALYPAARAGSPPPERPSASYIDFVRWQRSLLSSEEGLRQHEYWASAAAYGADVLRFPADRPFPRVTTFAGETLQFRVDREATSRLHALASRLSVTMNALLLAGFQALLHRWSGQERFTIRTVLSGRSDPAFAQVVGHFANAVPIRADFSDDPSFATLVERAKRSVNGAVEHQDVPLAAMAARLREAGTPAAAVSSNVMFRFQIPHRFRGELRAQRMPDAAGADGATGGGTRLEFGGLVAELWNPVRRVAYHAIDLELVEAGGEVTGYLHYWPDVFDAATIARVAGDYVSLLAEAVVDPEARLAPAGRSTTPTAALAKPGVARGHGGAAVPPATSTEVLVGLIWRHVLGIASVDMQRPFPDLGGDSLAAAEAGSLIAAEFGDDIPLGILLASPTAAEVAAHVDAWCARRSLDASTSDHDPLE